MSGYAIAWLAWAGGFAITEGLALANKRQGDTLSEETRKVFRTRSAAGRIVFGSAWCGFSAWYLGHILKWWP